MLFFYKGGETQDVWFYDLRTNMHFTKVQNPMKRSDLDEFVTLYNAPQRQETYNAETNPEGRWRKFSAAELLQRDKVGMDITWIHQESDLDSDASVEDLLATIDARSKDIASAIANLKQALL